MSVTFEDCLARLPLVAILRGITPEEIAAAGEILTEAGFAMIEVPLNSPRPFDSIAHLARQYADTCLVGAGTVIDVADVDRVADAGGRLLVMPHADVAVIGRAVARGMVCLPGAATATEGFAALRAGAAAIKLFPAESLGMATLSAWRSVFPRATRFLPVGGITPDNIPAWRDAGAAGFGLGSALYRAGMEMDELKRNARRFAQAGDWR